ncbi:hypothetical protein [Sorangium sp. So ce362]|uniref:hypothetical protein n=1 Tax=Sorangium sp. So ce362 TaxID=3133303 RepID=UPI003F6479D7
MRKKAGACCLMIVAIPALWGACAGETFVDARLELPCDTTDDCPSGEYEDGTECIEGYCECPNPDEEACCEPGAAFNECERKCRPAAECHVDLCTTSEECAGPVDSRCGNAQCVGGVCRLKMTKALVQLVGDCKSRVCDPTGRILFEEDPTDVFNDANECTFDMCMGSEIANTPYSAGPSPGSAARCDGAGRRVECVTDEDCGDPAIFCSLQGNCVPSWCTNGVKDTVGGETAIDCGGPCDPCAVGVACESDSDCIEQKCGTNKKCTAPECDDRIKNGSETDVDCGSSSCPPCAADLRCHAHDNCESGICRSGQCQLASCGDGAQNGYETEIDCGGMCQSCPLYLNTGADERP